MTDPPPDDPNDDDPNDDDPNDDDPNDDGPNDVDLVRRRFLLAGGRYVAPAVLASLFLGQEAAGQGGCPPYVNRCNPFRSCSPGVCSPLRNPCPPASGR